MWAPFFMVSIQFKEKAKLFFASDFHLGAPNKEQSDLRELKILNWLESILTEADGLFLVGDIFDFWFEYKTVVPKGFIRFLSMIYRFTEKGIPVYFFHGNHDLWMKDYFEKELGVQIIQNDLKVLLDGKSFLITHGDGLGPGDHTYKTLKKIFTNPIAKWLFRWLHPDIGVRIASTWSSRSRINSTKNGSEEFQGEQEWLYQYALEQERQEHHDYYIFGHRHLPIEMNVSADSKYINLGEWVNYCTYAKYENGELKLLTYEG